MNTHSNMADCRMELFAAHTAMYCADCRLIHNIMACITTDQVLDLLEERNLTKQVMTSILEKIDMHLTHRVGGQVENRCDSFFQSAWLFGRNIASSRNMYP